MISWTILSIGYTVPYVQHRSYHCFAFPYFISNKYHIFSSSPWLWKVYCWWHYWGSRTRTAHLSSPDVIPNKSPVWREQFFHRVLWRYTKLQIGHKSSSTTIVSLSEREVFWSKVLLFKCKWMGFALLMQKWIIRSI